MNIAPPKLVLLLAWTLKIGQAEIGELECDIKFRCTSAVLRDEDVAVFDIMMDAMLY
jgi:hypothetical protein